MGRKHVFLISNLVGRLHRISQDIPERAEDDGGGGMGGVGLAEFSEAALPSTPEKLCRPDVARVERELACHHLRLLKG